MSITSCTITHSFLNGDATSASGNVTFKLTGRMTNGTQTILPTKVTANLDSHGAISQALTANLDAGTIPNDAFWQVTLGVLGVDDPETYSIQVPSTAVLNEDSASVTLNSGTVQLSSLVAAPTMIGNAVTGSHIPAETTITAVDVGANQVTLSANATATATGLSLTITPPTSVDLGTLLPTSQQVS